MTTAQIPAAALEPAGTIYNRSFWLAYAANVSLVTANALTFRFAELVAFLGGSEGLAGTIVSLGVVAALVARYVLGQAIDRFGTRRIWAFESLLFTAGCVLFLAAGELSWVIYAARVLFAVGLAGMFTCSMVHIQNLVPPMRRTEVIGTLGTSGFVGMIAGSQLGDVIFTVLPEGRVRFVALFGLTAALGILHLALVVVLTRNDRHEAPHETPAAHRLLLRYWPGNVVLVAIMMGVGITVTTVFLTRFATHRGLTGIGTFFTAYAISAFTFRIVSRRWSRTIGRPRMILIGLAGQGSGIVLLSTVTRDWHFVAPAVAAGLGHALLFPAVVSLGSGAFPREYRGTGTTIVLGFTELGSMLSAPLLGSIIDHFDGAGFTQMFWTAGGIAVAIFTVYALTDGRRPDEESPQVDRRVERMRVAPHGREMRDREPEPVAAPFPQVGRNV